MLIFLAYNLQCALKVEKKQCKTKHKNKQIV